jgi:hypothetical protein
MLNFWRKWVFFAYSTSSAPQMLDLLHIKSDNPPLQMLDFWQKSSAPQMLDFLHIWSDNPPFKYWIFCTSGPIIHPSKYGKNRNVHHSNCPDKTAKRQLCGPAFQRNNAQPIKIKSFLPCS